MSRSGYSDDCNGWSLIRWRGAVNSAIKGKRGQAFLREALAALDAMPTKELIADNLSTEGGFCTLGAVGAARGMDMSGIDPDEREQVAASFSVAEALAAEIMFENDEGSSYAFWYVNNSKPTTPAQRWQHMRDWIAKHISPATKEPT